MSRFDTLKAEVIDCDLCTRCGTCIGICPTGTISYKDGEIADTGRNCIQCGMCMAVCPGKSFPMDQWAQKLFHEAYDTEKLFGVYQGIWNACAGDEGVRNRGGSGGVVTQLLVDLLERNVIEGAVTLQCSKKAPYVFEPCIADSREQILASAQSKYMIVPVNQVIRELKESGKRVAYVGLPCQIQGMRKAMEKNPWLEKQIVVLISLFCGFNMEEAATDYLIAKSGMKKEEIKTLSYRYKKGAQTGFYLRTKVGKEFFVSKHGYTFLNLLFSPKRCWKCYDYSGEFADIAVGDAWEKGQGFSRVIVRTQRGREIFEQAVDRGVICAEPGDEAAIKKTQNKVVSYKKRQIGIRAERMRHFPDYGVVFAPCSAGMRRKGRVLYAMLAFWGHPVGKHLIRFLPFRCLVKISAKWKGREVVHREGKQTV